MPAVRAALSPSISSVRPGPIDYPRLALISVGHLTNDMYGNLLTALMPYLVLDGRITGTYAGLVLLVYLIGSSILQPLIGTIVDRSERRIFAVTGPLVVGLGAVLAGWVSGAAALFGLAALSGVGTAAFHPQAAAMVDRSSTERKGRSMAIFSMGGNVGFALGPVLAAVIAGIGLHWSPIIILPGIAVTLALFAWAPVVRVPANQAPAPSIRRAFRGGGWPLADIVAVIALRSATQYAMILFLPLYYHARGFSPELGSYYAFVLSLAGAVGGLFGGHLSDLYGRKLVVTASLAISAPLLVVTLLSPVILVWPLLALSGAALLSSNSVTVVQGQELLPGSAGVAAGITMGLGFGLSGVVASCLSTLSDHIGVQPAIFLVPLLPLLGAVLAATVPSRRRVVGSYYP